MSRPLRAVPLGGQTYQESPDLGRPRPWILDGQGPVPPALAGRLTRDGEPARLATFGRVRAVLTHDFGPPLGPRPVVVCEKWAGVDLGGLAAAPYDAQGILLPQLAALLAAHGLG
jgi:hypothetical protein